MKDLQRKYSLWKATRAIKKMKVNINKTKLMINETEGKISRRCVE